MYVFLKYNYVFTFLCDVCACVHVQGSTEVVRFPGILQLFTIMQLLSYLLYGTTFISILAPPDGSMG